MAKKRMSRLRRWWLKRRHRRESRLPGIESLESRQLLAGQGLDETALAFQTEVAQVVGRHVYYNESAFDSNNSAVDQADDGAIARDKAGLLPGEIATFANYTSYHRGINGIIIDVANLARPDRLGADDFEFRVGNVQDVSNWIAAPAPINQIADDVRASQGTDGSDRITIRWEDFQPDAQGAPLAGIGNQWLEVTVQANGNTGLVAPDVFYFGNAIGETGNSNDHTFVDGSDFAAVRDHPRSPANPAVIDDPHDFNRDSLVDGSDLAIVRDHATSFLTDLIRFDAPFSVPLFTHV